MSERSEKSIKGRPRIPRPTQFKEKARARAKALGRKVLWLDKYGLWHTATDRFNTPHWAVETEDV